MLLPFSKPLSPLPGSPFSSRMDDSTDSSSGEDDDDDADEAGEKMDDFAELLECQLQNSSPIESSSANVPKFSCHKSPPKPRCVSQLNPKENSNPESDPTQRRGRLKSRMNAPRKQQASTQALSSVSEGSSSNEKQSVVFNVTIGEVENLSDSDYEVEGSQVEIPFQSFTSPIESAKPLHSPVSTHSRPPSQPFSSSLLCGVITSSSSDSENDDALERKQQSNFKPAQNEQCIKPTTMPSQNCVSENAENTPDLNIDICRKECANLKLNSGNSFAVDTVNQNSEQITDSDRLLKTSADVKPGIVQLTPADSAKSKPDDFTNNEYVTIRDISSRLGCKPVTRDNTEVTAKKHISKESSPGTFSLPDNSDNKTKDSQIQEEGIPQECASQFLSPGVTTRRQARSLCMPSPGGIRQGKENCVHELSHSFSLPNGCTIVHLSADSSSDEEFSSPFKAWNRSRGIRQSPRKRAIYSSDEENNESLLITKKCLRSQHKSSPGKTSVSSFCESDRKLIKSPHRDNVKSPLARRVRKESTSRCESGKGLYTDVNKEHSDYVNRKKQGSDEEPNPSVNRTVDENRQTYDTNIQNGCDSLPSEIIPDSKDCVDVSKVTCASSTMHTDSKDVKEEKSSSDLNVDDILEHSIAIVCANGVDSEVESRASCLVKTEAVEPSEKSCENNMPKPTVSSSVRDQQIEETSIMSSDLSDTLSSNSPSLFREQIHDKHLSTLPTSPAQMPPLSPSLPPFWDLPEPLSPLPPSPWRLFSSLPVLTQSVLMTPKQLKNHMSPKQFHSEVPEGAVFVHPKLPVSVSDTDNGELERKCKNAVVSRKKHISSESKVKSVELLPGPERVNGMMGKLSQENISPQSAALRILKGECSVSSKETCSDEGDSADTQQTTCSRGNKRARKHKSLNLEELDTPAKRQIIDSSKTEDPVLSGRARIVHVKNAGREIGSLVKHPGVNANDVADRLSNHANPVPVSIIVDQILKVLQGVDCDLLTSMYTECASAKPVTHPFLSQVEGRMMELVQALIVKPNMMNIASVLSSALLSALMKDASLILAKLTLCRMLTAVCRYTGDICCVRSLLFYVMYRQMPGCHAMVLVVIGVWPSVVCPSSRFSACIRVVEYAVYKRIQQHPASELKMRTCLQKLTGWKGTPVCTEEMARMLVEHLCEASGKSANQVFETCKALVLLAVTEGWQWAYPHIIQKLLLPVLHDQESKNYQVNDTLLRAVLTVLGEVCHQCPAAESSCVVGIMKSLSGLLSRDAQSSVHVQEGVLNSLIRHSAFCPLLVATAIHQYKTKNQREQPAEIQLTVDTFWSVFKDKLPFAKNNHANPNESKLE